ncbi:thiol-disulfide oxidoreductase ResA [Bacillus sp. JCM 19034]|uniref:thiol-disulfide oxidoreductase ResA n=1 Tax=Bacillus sp. JCM 19034 TaxID=1481928 RepID=UPI000782A819|nr:thiol-disulfide oxidoreductase ResA [Bacillus sp. JCM 19034]
MKQKRLVMRTIVLVIIGAALAYTFYSQFFMDKSIAKVGDESINFALTDLNGERVELSDFEGKGVFLNFWGTFCPPCEKEMPIMEELYDEYKEKGVEIIAVNVNEPKLTVERFASRYNLTFPIVIDKGRSVTNAYGVHPLPTTILINEHGFVEQVFEGGMTESMVRDFMERIIPEGQ